MGLRRAWLPSPFALAALSALVALGLAGLLLWHVAPKAPPASSVQLADQVLDVLKGQIHPKPQVQFVYVGLILATPFLLTPIAGLFARRLGQVGPADVALLALGLGAAAYVLGRDALAANVGAPKWLFAAAALAGLAAGYGETRLDQKIVDRLRLGIFATLCVLCVLLTYSWRTFDAVSAITAGQHIHLGAFIFSIVQSAHGATCTVDLTTQYGCYGEFYAPVLAVIGKGVAKIVFATNTLIVVSSVSVFWVCFKTIRSPLLLTASGLVFLAVTNNVALARSPDPYFQYMPLRELFPALSLVLAWVWRERSSLRLATGLGAFSAAAVLWNPDSGAVVLGALGLLVTAGRKTDIGTVARRTAAFGLGVLAALALFWAWWSLAGRHLADFGKLFLYGRLFAGAGMFLLPTPAAPAAWTVAIAVAAIGLTGALLAILRGQDNDPRAVLPGYVAILGVGLLSYYLGRSVPTALAAAAWPLEILAFMLLDGPWPAGRGRHATALAVVGRGAALPCCLAACAAAFWGWPVLAEAARERWRPILDFDFRTPAAQDFQFVRTASGGEPFDVISPDQAIFHAQTKTAAHLPGPGVDELALKRDVEADIAYLKSAGPPHLFVSADAFFAPKEIFEAGTWVNDHLPVLKKAYALKDWSATGDMLHLVRKPYAGRDLFDWPGSAAAVDDAGRPPTAYMVFDPQRGTLLGDLGRPLFGPIDWIRKPLRFHVMLKVKPDPAGQKPYAAMISSHGGMFHGVVIDSNPGSAPGHWSLGAGDGTKWIGADFDLPVDRPSTLILRYTPERIVLTVDGRQVAEMISTPGHPFFPEDGYPLTIGDWAGHDRKFAGVIYEAAYWDDTAPR